MASLSEHERKQLRLLEAQLHAEDPKFVKTMRTKQSVTLWRRPKARNAMLSAIGLVLGITGLIVGLVIPGATGVSLAGLVMFCLGVYFVLAWVFSEDVISMPRAKTKTFMANLEARWDERKRDSL